MTAKAAPMTVPLVANAVRGKLKARTKVTQLLDWTQCLAQAVRVQEVEGDDLVRLQRGGVGRQHVAYRAEFPPALVAEYEGRLTSGEQMQHELFDMTALSEEEAEVPPVATFFSWQEVVAATRGVVAPWTEDQLLELATSTPAMRTIRHQPRPLRMRTACIILAVTRSGSSVETQESLQAAFAAAACQGVWR